MGFDAMPSANCVRFVADIHLGKLVTYLRMLGFDTLYRNDFEDDELVHLSRTDGRILLSQDRGLLGRKEVTRGHLVRESDPRLQVAGILTHFDLRESVEPFERCLRCNTILEPISKDLVVDRIPAQTRKEYDEFWTCQSCNRVYWMGKHFHHMQKFISELNSPG